MVSVGPPTAFYAGMKWNFGAEPSGWMASARDQLARERGEDAPAPRRWAGLYAGLNAGYGWGATTGVGVLPNGLGDRFASLWNQKILAEEPADDGAAWWGLFQPTAPAIANSGVANVSRNGFVGGGQIGWNYQDESGVVLGAETDFQGTLFRGKGSYNGSLVERAGYIDKPEGGDLESLLITRQIAGGGNVSAGTDWLGTFRGKIGYAITDTLLAYGTGGLAYGNVHASAVHFNTSNLQREDDVGVLSWNYTNPPAFGGASYSGVRAGWSAGGGVEWMFANNWSAKAEGLYYNLGTIDLVSSPLATVCSSQAVNSSPGACARGQAGANRIIGGGLLWASSPVSKVQFDGVMLRAGVNYHFNWGSNLF
ncbi:outer membrane protein [Methylocystis sp. JAN1]|uniref:outer membrane protein n=1 Tax=Methylocystis sp. JAN1 TaxID=3397211 RepID=UPI003FA1E7AA